MFSIKGNISIEMAKFNKKIRHRSRILAMQAIYQWNLSQDDLNVIEAQFHIENDNIKVDWLFFTELLRGVPSNLSVIDRAIREYISRDFDDLNHVELSILRLGIYELAYRIDIPYQAVINEYIELAKKYGAEEGYKFVNAVLDKQVKVFRRTEV